MLKTQNEQQRIPLGIKLVVAEQSGIRRFLYPLRVKIPSVYRRSVGKLALADADGKLIPSHVAELPGHEGVQCTFAVSMSPLETQELQLVRLEGAELLPVPDPLNIHARVDGIASEQQQVSFSVNDQAQLTSVVYDDVEHLAKPLTISLDGTVMTPAVDESGKARISIPQNGLYAQLHRGGAYDKFLPAGTPAETSVELTCCKSWVWVRHTLDNPWAGAVLRFSLPLTVTAPIATCDFGIDNGAYGKIQAGLVDQVVWETDLSVKNAARYRIRSRHSSGEMRTDYAGEVRSPLDLASRLWLHWNEREKALALAITDIARGCDQMVVRLNANGLVEIDFVLGKTIARPAEFGICCHFLNDIPPIAAATNPASILMPPNISVLKAGG